MGGVLDLLTLLVFLCTLCAFYGVLGLSKRRQLASLSARRLSEFGRAPVASERIERRVLLRHAPRIPLAQVPLVGRVTEWLWTSIGQVEWQHTLALRMAIIGLASLLLGVMLGGKTPVPLLASPLFSLAIALAAFFLVLRRALGKWHAALRRSLPEAIDAITRTCRAGVPVGNAFAMVTDNLRGPLVGEFQLIDQWLRLGVPLRRVMQDSAKRVPLPEYRFFAVILIINQESGGRLGETLDRLAQTLRDRQELQMKILAKTSEARASAKIVAALVPGMMGYMYVNAPADFQFLFSDPTGTKVLTYVVISVCLGLTIVHLMVRRLR